MSTNVFSNSQNQTEKQNNFFHKNMNLNDLFSLHHLLTVKCGLIALIKQRVGSCNFQVTDFTKNLIKNNNNKQLAKNTKYKIVSCLETAGSLLEVLEGFNCWRDDNCFLMSCLNRRINENRKLPFEL